MTAALKLFNKKGLKEVSVRDICKKLKISPGNFHYHFPRMELLIKELYEQMNTEVYEVVKEIPTDHSSVVYFLDSHQKIFHIQNRYKFFFLNLFEILSNFPEIRQLYVQRYAMEKKLARDLLILYAETGVLKKEMTEIQMQRLVDVGYILNNAWHMDAEIAFQGSLKEKMIHYMQLCCGRLDPFLTPVAKKEYEEYFRQLSA